jgi:hypothetical protein
MQNPVRTTTMGYEELKEEIEKAPMTWLPGLLITTLQTACRRRVFQPGGASKVTREIEERFGMQAPDEDTRTAGDGVSSR